MDKDELLFELVNGIIGDYYPMPSRSLKNSEKIFNKYLESTLYNGVKLADSTDVFPTEGGSAAMCYIFNALSHNKLLNPGDKIAIGTPIFTPYLQIPDVNNSDIAFLNDLASKKGVVLMYGPGFDAPKGSVRVSLANQNKEAYVEIARRMRELLEEYYTEFNKSKAVKVGA